ncbi:hypothetical protein [Vibrio cincinnatiensis]|uniref:hypothetical protein n=1 Tax=Vibrio cincinnatiensis TaxID=675 RepID=UPI001EDF70DE|nr:hypothetical protein [Vibrio cincinnatiensis]MCG3727433.1 hypothetical protein [Vibrio cincinnatiensis]
MKKKYNYLNLFAPKFNEFALDIIDSYAEALGVEVSVFGLNTGTSSIHENVSKQLGENLKDFWNIEAYELDWIRNDYSEEILKDIEKELGVGSIGKILTADRRVGAGLVSGGRLRPDLVESEIIKGGSDAPYNYICGLYLFLKDVLRESEPNCVFCYAVAGAPALMLGMLCKARRIKFLRFSHSRIENYFILDDDPHERVKRLQNLYKEKSAFGLGEFDDSHRHSQNILSAFRNKKEAPQYMKINQEKRKRESLMNKIVKYLRPYYFRKLRSVDEIIIRRHLFDLSSSVLAELDMMFLSKHSKRLADIEKKSYVYFPLHVDPESSTMVLNYQYTNQLSLIENIVKSLPPGFTLVVKEHFPMIGKRPRGFYKRINKLPLVDLLHPDENSQMVIEKSKIVMTNTGTAAWEAVQLGVPAVVLGDVPFSVIENGIRRIQDIACLPYIFEEALSMTKANDEELLRYIESVVELGVPFDSGMLWGDYMSYDKESRSSVSYKIAKKMIEYYEA